MDAEFALKLSEILSPESYAKVMDNKVLPHHLKSLTHAEWTEMGIPIGTGHAILEMAGHVAARELAPFLFFQGTSRKRVAGASTIYFNFLYLNSIK